MAKRHVLVQLWMAQRKYLAASARGTHAGGAPRQIEVWRTRQIVAVMKRFAEHFGLDPRRSTCARPDVSPCTSFPMAGSMSLARPSFSRTGSWRQGARPPVTFHDATTPRRLTLEGEDSPDANEIVMDPEAAWTMRAAFARDTDWSLTELVRMIDITGTPFPLTVLTHGVMVKGIAVKIEHWADHLDVSMDALLGGAAEVMAQHQRDLSVDDLGSAGTTAGDIEEQRSGWPEMGWRSLVNDRRAADARIRKQLQEVGEESAFTDLPDDLAQKAVQLELPPQALTIQDAKLLALSIGGGPMSVPYVRINVTQIGAWWPGGIDWSSLMEQEAG